MSEWLVFTKKGYVALTFGKSYEVIRFGNNSKGSRYVVLKNDNGQITPYFLSGFCTQEEWRDIKLNQLL